MLLLTLRRVVVELLVVVILMWVGPMALMWVGRSHGGGKVLLALCVMDQERLVGTRRGDTDHGLVRILDVHERKSGSERSVPTAQNHQN